MNASRIFSTVIVMSTIAGTTFLACGGDDSGSKQPDAKVYMDAPNGSGSGSGSGSGGASAIGQHCTPNNMNMQGDCPAGYTCLPLTGGTGPWCSKTCMRGSGADMCNVGYAGPGVAECIFNITFQTGSGSAGSAVPYCGIICADTTNTCGSACNGQCPGTMTCSRALMSGSGATVGSACF